MELKNVKSLLKGEITLEDVKQALSASKLDNEVLSHYLKNAGNSNYDTVICEGDLILDVDFDPYNFNVCNLIVKGSLTVPGLMTYYNDPATLVFVGGDLNAVNLVVGDTLEVCGNLNIKNAIVPMGAEHMCIHGDLNAKLFFPDESVGFPTVGGAKKVENAFTYQHRIPNGSTYNYLSDRNLFFLLKDSAFTDPADMEDALSVEKEEWNNYPYFDYVNFRGIVGMLCKRESIYRNE